MTRGRDAQSPASIPVKGWLDVGWRVGQSIAENRLSLIAAGIAFYALLSLFPVLTIAVAIVGLVNDPIDFAQDSSVLTTLVPGPARDIVVAQLEELTAAGQDTLGITAIAALCLTLWSSSKIITSFIQGLNQVYGETEQRGFVALKIATIAMTFLLILAAVLIITIVAAIPTVVSYIYPSSWLERVADTARWPVLFVSGVGGLALLYRFAPSRTKAKWRWLTPGAALACVLWLGASFSFGFFVNNFASYNETFGALGGVIVLLTWLWLTAFLVLLGAQLDAEIEAQTRKDSTVGVDKPMGERGAVKADTLGEVFGSDQNSEEQSHARVR